MIPIDTLKQQHDIMYCMADYIKYPRLYHRKTSVFKGSIADLYHHELIQYSRHNNVAGHSLKNSGAVNFPILCRVVNNYIDKYNIDPPARDVVYIHCRLGDLMGNYYKAESYSNYFDHSIQEIVNIFKMHPGLSSIKKAVVKYGNHTFNKDVHDKPSHVYIKQLEQELLNIGVSLTVEIADHHPGISYYVDMDFVTLVTARHYIPTVRGFSWLSACLNRNFVYWEIMKPPFFPAALRHIDHYLAGYKYHLNNIKLPDYYKLVPRIA